MCSNLWSSDCVLVGLYVIRGDLGLYFGLLFFLRLVWTNFASLVLLDKDLIDFSSAFLISLKL